MANSPNVVIVVEDEFLVRLTAVELLIDAGFVVLEAENADDALDILTAQADRVQLLLTDVRMSGSMDGVELACAVRANWPWMKILVVSGNFPPLSSKMPAGCDFIAKPYDPSEMVDRITALLDHADTESASKIAFEGRFQPLPPKAQPPVGRPLLLS